MTEENLLDMAANNIKYFHGMLECPSCLEQLDSTSKMLPCQHTFCRRCLDLRKAEEKKIICCVCKNVVEMEIESLPENLLLLRLLDAIQQKEVKMIGKKLRLPESTEVVNSSQVKIYKDWLKTIEENSKQLTQFFNSEKRPLKTISMFLEAIFKTQFEIMEEVLSSKDVDKPEVFRPKIIKSVKELILKLRNLKNFLQTFSKNNYNMCSVTEKLQPLFGYFYETCHELCLILSFNDYHKKPPARTNLEYIQQLPSHLRNIVDVWQETCRLVMEFHIEYFNQQKSSFWKMDIPDGDIEKAGPS